jgi:hypothetical protein
MKRQPWRLVLRSVVGTSHSSTGKPCEDASAHMLFECPRVGEVLIAVVSDGAGTASQSQLGSRLACETFIEIVRQYLSAGHRVSEINRGTAEEWLAQVASAIEERARDAENQTRDYACTLLAAVVSEDTAAFLQIGDGAIVISHGEEDGWSWVFWPQHGQFVNTTNFIVSENARDVLDFDLAPRRIDELAIFTDGLEDLVLHHASRTVHEPFFNSVFKPVRESAAYGYDEGLSIGLEHYLGSSIVCERTDDDKTLLIATRKNCIPDIASESAA